MKLLTPEERERLNFLYDLLDVNYHALRQAAQIQRAALLRGALAATVLADMDLTHLSRTTALAWAEIQLVLNGQPTPAAPAADAAAPEEPDAAAPKKETIQ